MGVQFEVQTMPRNASCRKGVKEAKEGKEDKGVREDEQERGGGGGGA